MINESLVRYTRHARLQMERRGITDDDVLEVLNSPDEFEQGSHSNETIAIKYLGKNRVRVVYISEPEEIRIITVTH
jgi:hypothetical protein